MLEIIALILLTRHIGGVATRKGLKPGTWKLYTVLSWFAGEIVGVVAGLVIFEQDNLVSLMLMGIAGALGGYFILKAVLDKKPDDVEDDINRIGVDDLRP
jgi:phage shock protein PspC (stress-responsive transcriptional regulator)